MSSIHHFQVVSHSKDGRFLLGSSALMGNVWDGGLSVFSGLPDFHQCPNLTMVTCNTPSGVNDAVWLPGEQSVLAGCDNGCVEVYRTQGPVLCATEVTVQVHDDMVLGVALLAGEERAVTVGQDSKVVVCSITEEVVLDTYRGHSDVVLAVAAHPTSPFCFITTSRDGRVRKWDIRKPLPATSVKGVQGSIFTSVAWSSHNDHIVALGSEQGSVVVLDWRASSDGDFWSKYQPHTRDVTQLTFAPWNHNVLASVSEDSTVKIYSVKDKATIYSSSEHTDYVSSVSWHPHQPHLISCGWDGRVLQHSASAGEAVTTDLETGNSDDKMVSSSQMSGDSEDSFCEEHQQMD